MIFERKAMNQLLDWKQNSQGKTALLIEGARRVGKSTLAASFANDNYKSSIIIDFSIASTSIKQAFLNHLNDLDTFYQILSTEYSVELHRRNSLIVLDEIQLFPKAREAVKHLVADGRYDILETGSLISIKENVEGILIPSEEDNIKLYPLDFEEFLWAAGERLTTSEIRKAWTGKIQPNDALHKKASRLIREYLLVGGMPQSIAAYLENDKSFYAADDAKRRILKLYEDDIKKAARKYSSRVSAIFENIPSFLAAPDKKVTLAQIDNWGKFDNYDEPFFWLADSMICNLCYKANDPNMGLALTKNTHEVKCYLGDTGLLFSQAFSKSELSSENIYKQILDDKLSINEGMFYENLVAQMLKAQGQELYFYSQYSPAKHRTDIEIDFLVTSGGKLKPKVAPIEVKSSKNYSAISYERFKAKFGERIGDSFIVHPKGFQKDSIGYRIPTYMLFCAFERN